MEVNDYLPNRVRVLSSEKRRKDGTRSCDTGTRCRFRSDCTGKRRDYQLENGGTSEDTDKMFGKLFLKQCHQLHDILPGLLRQTLIIWNCCLVFPTTNKDDVIYMLVNPETGIPEADFNVSTLDEEGNPTGQVEIIGWLYQYYNTELKDDTFAKLKRM